VLAVCGCISLRIILRSLWLYKLANNKSCQNQIRTRSRQPIECNFYELADDVPDPKEISPEHKNLMIFDDHLLLKQNNCKAYYVRGSHSDCDCLCLSLNYFKLPRQTIRDNANIFVCFHKIKRTLTTFITTTSAKI